MNNCNSLIIKVVFFKAQMPKVHLLQLLKCEYLLFFESPMIEN